MLEPALLEAFADELEKISSTELHDVEGLKKFLKPGDILYTKPKKIDKLHHRLFYSIESKIQGSDYTHVGIYVGDGHIVDAGDWRKRAKSSMKVHKIPLETYMKRYDFKVLRVDAPKAVKEEAVAYAKDQVGKDFNMKGMLRMVMPFQGSADKDRARKDAANAFFCSELVANAYNEVGLAKKKHLQHVLPGDIFRSPKTKTVAEFK